MYLFVLKCLSFLDMCPEVGMLGHMLTLFLIFKESPSHDQFLDDYNWGGADCRENGEAEKGGRSELETCPAWTRSPPWDY